jgi:hydroxyacylglutathione hydrolase
MSSDYSKTTDTVITISALGDNYIYLYQYNQSDAFAVDPGESSSVFSTLKKHKLNLTAVLLTHCHWDHTGGTAELKKKTSCKVIGPDKQRIKSADCLAKNKQVLEIGNLKIQVIATPGHTRTSVCYYIPPSNEKGNGILWTGDTLFVGGCGRLFECDASSMWDSLQKLASLPDDTLVYCGHDYTLENYEFALSIEPDNQAVQKCLNEFQQAQKTGKPTVPSTILRERETNPFLRADTAELRAALNMPHAPAAEVFAELRRRKDIF